MGVKLVLPDLREASIRSQDSALVIVDMENEFLHEDGKLFMGSRGLRAVDQAAVMLEKFREHHGKVIYIQSVRSQDAIMFTVFKQPVVLLEDTWAVQIVDKLKPLPDEIIVQKRSNDCFNKTNLQNVLDELGLVPGRSQIVVVGVASHIAVDIAVVGFSNRNYDVYVPVDAVASSTEEEEMMGFHHYFGGGYHHNVTPTRTELITMK